MRGECTSDKAQHPLRHKCGTMTTECMKWYSWLWNLVITPPRSPWISLFVTAFVNRLWTGS